MSSTMRPSLARCFLALLVVKLALVVAGARRIVRVISWRAGVPPLHHAASPSDIERLARRITTAAAFFPGRARCLEQSLVLWAMLRRSGIDARLRLGVRPHPFEAHAWVELDGQAILEDPEKVARVIPLPEPAR
jgi:hypothetical protein